MFFFFLGLFWERHRTSLLVGSQRASLGCDGSQLALCHTHMKVMRLFRIVHNNPLLLWLLPPFNFTSDIFVMHSESHTAAPEHLHFFSGSFKCASNALQILSVHIMRTLHPELIARHPCLVDVLRGSYCRAKKNSTFATDTRSPHPKHVFYLPPGGTCNLPTIPSASDFNTVLSSDQNTLDGTHSQHSQHSTSQDDLADIEEGNQCPVAVQLADAQVLATDAMLLPPLRVDLLPSFRLQPV